MVLFYDDYVIVYSNNIEARDLDVDQRVEDYDQIKTDFNYNIITYLKLIESNIDLILDQVEIFVDYELNCKELQRVIVYENVVLRVKKN